MTQKHAMRRLLTMVLSLTLIASSAAAQYGGYQALSDSAMDNLVGPVALYPDALLQQVLRAATFPDQVSAAETFVQMNPGADVSGQLWDPSVIAIANYPSVLQTLSNQPGWTQNLGQAYINQSQDLLSAVQRQRARAQQTGNLVTNSQQQVVVSGSTIQIVPTAPDVIYVPSYDPTVVYTQPANTYAPLVSFGAGMAVGALLTNGSSTTTYITPYSPALYAPPVYHAYGANGQAYYGQGSRGYGWETSTQGTGAWGNNWTNNNAAGGTWNGGSWSAHSQTNDWANGATTGSFHNSAVGPYGAANSRGWGYSNGDDQAGTFSKTVATQNGIYNIHGGGATNGDDSRGTITASGINRDGDYGTKSWTGNDGDRSSFSRSGNLFSGSESGSMASSFSNRGYESRSFDSGGFGGGDFGGRSFGGGNFGGGSFGGGGFRGGGFRR